jgi:hypothetical protein
VVPRRFRAGLGHEPVQDVDEPRHLLAGVVADGEHLPRVPHRPVVGADVDGIALPVPWERVHAEFVEQPDQRGLVGGHPLASHLEDGAVDDVRVGAPAHPVPGFHDGDRVARPPQFACRGQARGPRSDDDDVALDDVHEILPPRMTRATK